MRPLLALLLLAAAVPAAAQLPSAPCGPLSLSLAPEEATGPAGEPTVLTGSLQNRGSSAGTAHLAVTDAPEGWLTGIDNENVTLGANALGSFVVEIIPPAGASNPGDVTVSAYLECGLPVLRSSSVHATSRLAPTADSDRSAQLQSLAAEYAPFLLGAAVLAGLGGAAYLAIARTRRSGFLVDSAEPAKRLRPGRGVSFPFTIENRAESPDTAYFTVGTVPEGWSAFTAIPEAALGPGEKRTLWLMVRAPADAAEGTTALFEVAVRSDSKPERSYLQKFQAEVRHTLEETP